MDFAVQDIIQEDRDGLIVWRAGCAAIEVGDLDLAEKLAAQAQETSPDSPATKRLVLQIDISRGRENTAIGPAKQLWAAGWRDSQLGLILARHALAAGNRAGAIGILLSLGPELHKDQAACLLAAKLAFLRRDLTRAHAITAAAKRLHGDKTDPALTIIMIRCLTALGKPAMALPLAVDIAKKSPPSAKLFYRAALIAYRVGKWPTALHYFNYAKMFGAKSNRLRMLLARVQMELGNYTGAHAEFSALLRDDPKDGNARAGVGLCLLRLERFLEAVEALEAAALAQPERPDVRLWLAEALAGTGDRARAMTLVDALPADDAEATALRTRMTEDAGDKGGELVTRYIVEGYPQAFQPSWSKSTLRSTRTPFRVALRTSLDIIWAILLREVRTRFGRTKLGYLWALIEPSLQVLTMAGIWMIMGHGSLYGMPVVLFITLGIMPFNMFQRTSTRVEGAVKANTALLSHRNVKIFDVVMARAALEFLTILTVMAIFCVGMAISGMDITVKEPFMALGGLVAAWIWGIGMGLVIESFTPVLRTIGQFFAVLIRLLYFSSGVFFTLDMMPGQVQELLLWNPLLHCVETVRYAFHPHLDMDRLSLTYPFLTGFGLLLFGMISMQAMKEKVLER